MRPLYAEKCHTPSLASVTCLPKNKRDFMRLTECYLAAGSDQTQSGGRDAFAIVR